VGRHFHHLGVACRDLEADTRALRALGYEVEGADLVDRVQGIRGRFLTGPGPRLELLVELGDTEVLRPWLAQAVKIYHQAYQVDDLSAEIQALECAGARMVRSPVPAIAFGERRICFLMLRNLMLVELIEAPAWGG
jgi:methylmalonyl-CoA/ethylmalonyl-CoA epimerase